MGRAGQGRVRQGWSNKCMAKQGRAGPKAGYDQGGKGDTLQSKSRQNMLYYTTAGKGRTAHSV